MLWLLPSLATYLPDRLLAANAVAMQAAAPAELAPPSRSGSPVGDDFSDLFDDSPSQKNEPYYDDLQDLQAE